LTGEWEQQERLGDGLIVISRCNGSDVRAWGSLSAWRCWKFLQRLQWMAYLRALRSTGCTVRGGVGLMGAVGESVVVWDEGNDGHIGSWWSSLQ